jgi:DNA sulfur modification protein DndE
MFIKQKVSVTICLLFLILFACQIHSPDKIRIFLIGDSTMANKPLEDNPERGWGQMLPQFFNDRVEINNHAKNGRSTKSFIDQGLWQAVLDSLKPGDYVMIQFGHNDQKVTDSTRYADPHGAYKHNLQRFVNESRERGAQPILITPVMRRRFDEQSQFYDVHGDYSGVVREVAEQMQAPLIDLHQSSRELIVSLGEERSKAIFLWVEPGKYARFPDGKEDNTHFSEYGARQIAGLVMKGIKELDLKLKDHLKKASVNYTR